MKTRTSLGVSGAALFLAAGLATSVIAQTTRQPEGWDKTDKHSYSWRGDKIAAPKFCDSTKMIGEDVLGSSGEVVAKIDDFIIDRGSGRIEYAILESGEVLGIGGKEIALPYTALSYDPVNEQFAVNMTEEQIERAAEFSPENWTNLESVTWTDDLETWWDDTFGDDDDDRWGEDPYADDFADRMDAKTEKVDGEILRVVREQGAFGEHTCVEVKDDDGSIKRVVLGPSWFIMGGPASPMRGDSFEADVIPYSDTDLETGDDRADHYIAVNAKIAGERVELRDETGAGRWSVPTRPAGRAGDRDLADPDVRRDRDVTDPNAPTDVNDPDVTDPDVNDNLSDGPDPDNRDAHLGKPKEQWTPQAQDPSGIRQPDDDLNRQSRALYTGPRWGSGQLMLLSELPGADAEARDKAGGEIQQVIIESASGQIAFIGFDPNENVLGLADEIVLVPWPLVSINADHKARIDSSNDMLIASQPVPDDLSTLDSTRLGSIYSAYGIDQPEYYGRSHGARADAMATANWNADGAVMKAFRDGKEKTIEGRVVEVRDETLLSGEPDATVLIVRNDDGDHRVVVGPSWYITRKRYAFAPGDAVSIRGSTATFNGSEHIGAHSITMNDRKIVLWSGDDAAWNDD